MCNVNIVNRIIIIIIRAFCKAHNVSIRAESEAPNKLNKLFYVIFFSKMGLGVALATVSSPWLHPWTCWINFSNVWCRLIMRRRYCLDLV